MGSMIYEFADLRFDLERRQLTRDSRPIKLTKLDFRVLRALVEASPALVKHDDLIAQVWGPDRIITPENLSQRMKSLRQCLGDDPNHPTYIEGIRGQGFRLVPEAVVQTARQANPVFGRIWIVTLIAVFAALLAWFAFDRSDEVSETSVNTATVDISDSESRTVPTIAVLPFVNLSEDESNQFFTDGFHDDLLTRISNIRNIRTISRTSVMTYRGSDKNLGTIAKELRANTILEGGVQRAGDQVRINLQLIDAGSDSHLWAQTYTRSLSATNVFAIQAEITEAVASAMEAMLSADERLQLKKLPTTNTQALDAYFMANQFFNQATSEGVTKAIDAYQTAIKLDPEFALAYSKQAAAMLEQVYYSGLSVQTQLEVSRPLIDQAILLDPLSSEAFNALGKWYWQSGEPKKAAQAFEQAIELGPNNASALANYGNLMRWELSDPASAFELFQKAIELDPQNIGLKRAWAHAMAWIGRSDEGIRIMEDIVAEDPYSAAGYRDLAMLYSNWEFRHDKGIRALRKAFELDPSHPPNSYWNAIMHWRLGDYENTALWMNHIASLVPDSEEARVYRGWAFIAQRDFERAREEFSHSNSTSPLYWLGIFYLGNVNHAKGRPADAIEQYKTYDAEFDGRKSNVNFYYGIAVIKAYQALGEQDNAQALIDELMLTLKTSPSLTYHDSAIHEASLYALSGQTESAIATLEDWVNRGGATSLLQQDIRQGLGALGDDPRFLSILRTVNDRLSHQRANIKRWEANGEMLPMPTEVTTPGYNDG